VFEPFVNRDFEMSGVPIAMLLAAAGVDMGADLLWTGLDDYQVTFTGAAAALENAMLATRVNGQPISIADGGPTRLVFPDADGRLGRDSNQWIWSIESVSVT
jgi:DMSO/TMAO reductase YedYZ molybdopterin-dependent catalytic subunit